MRMEDIAEYEDGELLKLDGYDDCVIGIAHRFGNQQVLAYDLNKILLKLQERDGMSYEEAVEFFEYNMLGSYVGDRTPLYVMPFDP